MENLRTVGEKLGKYELEKRHAIELEDYERARQKKNQMEEYRTNAYEQINVEQLLERNGVSFYKNETFKTNFARIALPKKWWMHRGNWSQKFRLPNAFKTPRKKFKHTKHPPSLTIANFTTAQFKIPQPQNQLTEHWKPHQHAK